MKKLSLSSYQTDMSQILKITLLVAIGCFIVASAAQLRVRRGSLTDDAERLLKQGAGIDTSNVAHLVDLVDRNNAEECLSRVICELSSQTRAYGDEGAKFAQALLKFRQSKHQKVKQYIDAMNFGIKAKALNQCTIAYPNCVHQTSEVVSVGNRLLKIG